MGYNCFKCQQTFRSVRELLCHFSRDHVLMQKENYKCRQGRCLAEYGTCHAFAQHLRKKHHDETGNILVGVGEHSSSARTGCDEVPMEDDTGMLQEDDCTENGQTSAVFMPDARPMTRSDIKHFSDAFIYAELKKDATITQSTVDKVTEGVTRLVGEMMQCIEAQVLKLINKCQIPESDVDVRQLKDTIEVCRNPFQDFRTSSEISNYYESQEGFVKAKEHSLGYRWDLRMTAGNKYEQILVPNTCHIVSINDILTMVARNPEVRHYLALKRRRKDGIIADFCDGEIYRQLDIFAYDGITFQIMLYADEFETVNPLGSKTGNQKLVAIYMTLRNLPPEFNSCFSNIHLVALVHADDVKTYGYNKVLEPVVNELKALEVGVPMAIADEVQTVKGVLVDFAGDNLARHQIFGFLQSFRANYFCEWCMTDQELMQNKFHESDFQLRTATSLASDVQAVKDGTRGSNETGVRDHSVLNSLTYFHTLNSGPEVMHDILEGILVNELKLLFNYLAAKGIVTIDHINAQIASFHYSVGDVKSKPSCVVLSREDCNQSAVQMWTLARLLPFMIGHHIATHDLVWKLFLLLRKIMDIVFAPKVTNGMLLLLEECIVDHHTLYRKVYPDERLKPKHHFLVHYAHYIRKTGPLINKWTLRFEGKHRFFKRIPAVIPNFKNVGKTFAHRHSLSQFFHWRGEFALKSSRCGPGRMEFLMHIVGSSALLEVPELVADGEVLCVSWAEYCGTKYKSDMFVIHNRSVSSELLEFGKICRIFPHHNQSIYLLLQTYETVGFDEHFHAYVLDVRQTGWKVVPVDSLLDHHPVSPCSSSRCKQNDMELLVALRYVVL